MKRWLRNSGEIDVVMQSFKPIYLALIVILLFWFLHETMFRKFLLLLPTGEEDYEEFLVGRYSLTKGKGCKWR
jgi:hypothetical protein